MQCRCGAVWEQGAHQSPALSPCSQCPARVRSPSRTHLHLQPEQPRLLPAPPAAREGWRGWWEWAAAVQAAHGGFRAFQEGRQERVPLPWSGVSPPQTPTLTHCAPLRRAAPPERPGRGKLFSQQKI